MLYPNRLSHHSDGELTALNEAEVNLALATGLPGSEFLVTHDCLATLDAWVHRIAETTQRYLPRFQRAPSEFGGSEAQFRILCMVTVLQRDLGVCYKPECVEGDYNALDSRTHFIHGPLTGFGGTCINLPVLYLAVGRRLGYPVKLVAAKEHLFVRWRGDEVFNIEATSLGFLPRADEYYYERPRPLTASDLASGRYLRDFTPEQEIANFLLERGHVALDNLWIEEALNAFERASAMDERYLGDVLVAKVSDRILGNLNGRLSVPIDELPAAIRSATPAPTNHEERWAMPHAQVTVLRILRLRHAKTSLAGPIEDLGLLTLYS